MQIPRPPASTSTMQEKRRLRSDAVHIPNFASLPRIGMVASGGDHTLAISEYGRSVFGRHSVRFREEGSDVRTINVAIVPVHGTGTVSDIVCVSTGTYHSGALTSDGEVLLFGWHCGKGPRDFDDAHDTKMRVKFDRPMFGGVRVTMVACGGSHTLMLTEQGTVFGHGRSDHGELGIVSRLFQTEPVEIDAAKFDGDSVAFIAAGSFCSVVIASNGNVWTFGNGAEGRLGHDTIMSCNLPKKLQGQFGGASVCFAACGLTHIMFLTRCGVLWGCGDKAFGQLGIGKIDLVVHSVPVRVGGSDVFGGSPVRMVDCGNFFTVAVTEAGMVWTWGNGNSGPLGHGDTRCRIWPTMVKAKHFGFARITAVTAGCGHMAALAENGAIFMCGQGGLEGAASYSVHCKPQRYTPCQIAPSELEGLRIGRGLPLPASKCLAFAMGTHTSLSRRLQNHASPVFCLEGNQDLVRMIAEACEDAVLKPSLGL